MAPRRSAGSSRGPAASSVAASRRASREIRAHVLAAGFDRRRARHRRRGRAAPCARRSSGRRARRRRERGCDDPRRPLRDRARRRPRRRTRRGPPRSRRLCRELGARFVHVSTDYVFDGARHASLHRNGSHRRRAASTAAPSCEGERARARRATRRDRRAHAPGSSVRAATSCAPSSRRPRARGAARRRRCASSTTSAASPTYAGDLAGGIVGLVDAKASGIFHLANAGIATWWELARAAVDAWGHPELPIEKVRTEEFPRPAPRPAWSVLDTAKAARLGVQLRDWRSALQGYLDSDASPLREQELAS